MDEQLTSFTSDLTKSRVVRCGRSASSNLVLIESLYAISYSMDRIRVPFHRPL